MRHEAATPRKNAIGLLRVFVSAWSRTNASSRQRTTDCAASPIESAVVKFIALSRSSRFPSSTFVPSMRITIGTGTPSSLTAAITPCASTSHRRCRRRY
jgi:hypothetical protein